MCFCPPLGWRLGEWTASELYVCKIISRVFCLWSCCSPCKSAFALNKTQQSSSAPPTNWAKKTNKSCVGKLNNVLQMWADILPVNEKKSFYSEKEICIYPPDPSSDGPLRVTARLPNFKSEVWVRCGGKKSVFSSPCFFFPFLFSAVAFLIV